MMPRRTPRMLKKIKNCPKHNLEDEANNMQLDKEDIQRVKLNGKYLTVVLKYLDSLIIVFIVLNKLTCKVQLDLALRSLSKHS